uniref:Csu type fimbrial protein n=1 Tax=uncultured Sphingomonas sp. TaxID=158754 RepID=UPI0035CAFD14
MRIGNSDNSFASAATRKARQHLRWPEYAWCLNSSRTLKWGNTVGTDTVVGTGSGAGQAIKIYGQAAAGKYIMPSIYFATIVVTLFY